MFGFLSPKQPPRAWRQSYARVCQYQRNLFGITSLPFLSYEAAFLYQLAVDFDTVVRLSDESPTCCRLRRLPGGYLPDQPLGEFAATFGMVLTGVKLQDDLLDSNRWFNRLLWWKYRKQVSKAKQLMESNSPGLLHEIGSCIERHANMEQRAPIPTLDELVVPTGDGFAKVFLAAAKLMSASIQSEPDPSHHESFAAIGRHIGQAIIAWDCAVDFEYDRLQKQFTPLNSLNDVNSAFEMCQLELARAAWLCPVRSVSQEILANVQSRVRARQAGSTSACNPTRLERWGFLRQRGSAYARCDGCEALCCAAEVANCFLSASSPGLCSSTPEAGCCEGIVWLCPDGSSKPALPNQTSKGSGDKPNPSSPEPPPSFDQFVGRVATTACAFTPVGLLLIDNYRIPARSNTGEFINPGTEVRIVSSYGFGVNVERY